MNAMKLMVKLCRQHASELALSETAPPFTMTTLIHYMDRDHGHCKNEGCANGISVYAFLLISTTKEETES